jgi:SagB-type dehydrogenase family enzyme
MEAAGGLVDWGERPAVQTGDAESARIALPAPRGWNGPSIEQAIETRRSRRSYARGPLRVEELSRLLHASSGITDPERGFRAAPSAGALYPIETYAIVHAVADLQAGVYHYAPGDHTIELVRTGDYRASLVVAGIGQEMLGRAQVCFVLASVFQRARWRYRERAYRYILLEAGHIAQNVYLAATALGLGACAIGAFLDDNVNDLVGLDGKDEAAVYVLSVGRV